MPGRSTSCSASATSTRRTSWSSWARRSSRSYGTRDPHAPASDTPPGYGGSGIFASMSKQQEGAERGGEAVSLPVTAPAAEAPERNGTGGSPFGGLSIDFSGDTTVGAPAAPAPLPEIAYDSPSVMTVPGGPGHTATGEGRTETKRPI